MSNFDNKIKVILIAIITSFIFTAFFTWPFLVDISTYCEKIGDYPSEALGLLDSYKTLFENKGGSSVSSNFYPFPNSNLFGENPIIRSLFIFTPFYIFLKNHTLAVNLSVFIALALTCFSSFMVLYYFSKNIKASILGSIIFSFSPLVMIRFPHQAVLFYRFFIPPLFLFFILMTKKLKLKYAFLFYICFTLNALTNHYFLFLSSFILFIIFVSELILLRNLKKIFLFLKKFALINLIGVIFIPFLFLYYKPYYDFSQKEGLKRTIYETAFHSAQVSDFFSTTPNNQFFTIFKRDLPQADFAEHVLFPGLLVYAVLIIGLFFIKYENNQRRNLLIISYLILIFSFMFALGPFFKAEGIINTGLKLPYYYLYKFLPILNSMRVPERILLLSSFFMALIVSHTCKSLSSKMNKKYVYIVFYMFLIFLLFEYKNTYSSSSCKNDFTNTNIENKKVIFLPDYALSDFPQNGKYINFALLNNIATMVNGYGGYFPQEYLILTDYLNQNIFQDKWFAILKTLDLDYVFLDKEAYKKKFKKDMVNLLLDDSSIVKDDKNETWLTINLREYKNKYCVVTKDIKKIELTFGVKPVYQQSEPINIELKIKNNSKCIMKFFYDDRYLKIPFFLQKGIYNKDLKDIKYLKAIPVLFPNEEYNTVLNIFNEQKIGQGQYNLVFELNNKVYQSDVLIKDKRSIF